MESVSRLYLDTNILMMGEGSGPIAGLLYELVGNQESSETPFLCTSEISLAELLVHPLRYGNERLIQRYDDWLVDSGWLAVGPVARDCVYYAAVLRSQYGSIRLPDAIHLSTAIGFSCSHFLTGDKRIPERIEFVHTRHGLTKARRC